MCRKANVLEAKNLMLTEHILTSGKILPASSEEDLPKAFLPGSGDPFETALRFIGSAPPALLRLNKSPHSWRRGKTEVDVVELSYGWTTIRLAPHNRSFRPDLVWNGVLVGEFSRQDADKVWKVFNSRMADLIAAGGDKG